PTYTRRRVLTIAIVTAASPAGIPSLNAGVPADRRIVAASRFDVTSAPLQAEVVQLVVDFLPGAWTSWHTHGGQAINLVLEGEITLRHAGMKLPHRAGQAWTDSSGQVHAAGNTGPGKARLLTNFLLPAGVRQTHGGEGCAFGTDDRVRGEVSFAGSARRNGNRAGGGRPRFRLAHATGFRRLYGKRHHRRGRRVPGRRRTQGLQSGGELVGAPVCP